VPKVVLQGHIVVPDKELTTIEKGLTKHIELTLQEPGCLVFQVTPDPIKKNQFNVYEEFTDLRAFNAHQERVKQSHWGQITKNVQRHYQITEHT